MDFNIAIKFFLKFKILELVLVVFSGSKLKGIESQNNFGYPSEDFIDNYLYEINRRSYEN